MHQGAEQIPLATIGETDIYPNTAKGFAAPAHRLARGTCGIDCRGCAPISPENTNAVTGDNAIAAEGLREMTKKIDIAAAGAAGRIRRAPAERPREGIGRECLEAIAKITIRKVCLRDPKEFRSRLIVAHRKRIGV